jgi:uncharacterized protein
VKIGIISDTHDNISNIGKSMSLFMIEHVGFVIHAGEITTPEAVESFRGVTLLGVLGNNDLNIERLADAFEDIGGQLKGEFGEIEQDHLLLVVYNGTNHEKKESFIRSGNYDVVISGHTHKSQNRKNGNTLVINPGTANGWFFGYNATVSIFDTKTILADIINL